MKLATAPASRREQERALRKAVAVMGERIVRVILEAVTQQSKRPPRKLPDEWRDRTISAFRQFIKK